MEISVDWNSRPQNDRIEYANHAVFLRSISNGQFVPPATSLTAVRRKSDGKLKPHALAPFYRSLSHWCIFIGATRRRMDARQHTATIPPMHVHIEHVELTDEQIGGRSELTGKLVVTNSGGITQRGKIAQIAKGKLTAMTWRRSSPTTSATGSQRTLMNRQSYW